MPREVTMIERIRNAMLDDMPSWTTALSWEPDETETVRDFLQGTYLNKIIDEIATSAARAAIKAMREPTSEMCNAGKSQEWHKRLSNGTTIPVPGFDTGPLSVWRRMIDAALSETPDAA